MVLYWTRSHSFVRFLGCGTTVLLPNKRSGREVQPLAALAKALFVKLYLFKSRFFFLFSQPTYFLSMILSLNALFYKRL